MTTTTVMSASDRCAWCDHDDPTLGGTVQGRCAWCDHDDPFLRGVSGQGKTVQFIASSNPDVLAAQLAGRGSATVEAEYGDRVVVGSVVTMAHHGPRAGERAPCAYQNPCNVCGGMGGAGGWGADHGYDSLAPCHAGPYVGDVEVVGLSHVDLDTLGGCAALLGRKPEWRPEWDLFWQAAEFVDLNGPHKLDRWVGAGDRAARKRVADALYAFWAWSQDHRVRVTSAVTDVTAEVHAGIAVITAIFAEAKALADWRSREPDVCRGLSWSGASIGEALDDARTDAWEAEYPASPYHEAGLKWLTAAQSLDWDSFVGVFGGTPSDPLVVLRQAPEFVNHLYKVERCYGVASAVVGYNTETGAVTVSVADPVPGFSCSVFVQGLWGPLAGGHDGIAGSPRGLRLSSVDASNAAMALAVALAEVAR